MSTTPTTSGPAGSTPQEMQAQADANFARQVALQMVAENISAKTNSIKTVHEAVMSVTQNFK